MSTLHAAPRQKSPPRPPSDATRHLCAGVYADEKFRDMVIGEIATASFQRVAPSYGFDLVPVMHHAWRATHLGAVPRIAIVFALLTPLIWGLSATSAVVACGLVLLVLLRHALHLSTKIANENEPPLRNRKRKVKRRFSLEGWRWKKETRQLKHTGVCALAAMAFMLLFIGASPSQGQLGLYLLGVIAAITFLSATVRQLCVNHIQKASRLRPHKLSRREQKIDEQQYHDCVVYRRPQHSSEPTDELASFPLFGEESPFIGAGEAVYQWDPPMNVQLLRPTENENEPLHKREHAIPPFRAHELVERLHQKVNELRTDEPNVRLPVEVRNRVYAAESDLSKDRTLLSPAGIEPDRMRALINGEDDSALHFIEVSVPSHGSELVTTVFLHVKLQGRTLTLFCVACALTRNPREFQRVKEYGQNGKRAVLAAGAQALLRLPQEISDCLRLPLYPYYLTKSLLLGSDRTLRPRRNIEIGSKVSAREEHAQEWRQVQFDQAQVLSHVKTVEERMLGAISDFLHENNVDNSEFDKRAKKLVQNSFNIGSNTTILGSAVGHGAYSTNTSADHNKGVSAPSDHGGHQ
ncbi:hypothetical protein [Nocardiopsis alkaliphila]|uniref:hypothetical protein n=1 Tax=Nocardiopsis alkaliphila TaxID=225762 RepID=UPI00034D1C58|nr:hypothetical protein [Nocardiopsis alkaliphila]